MIKRVRQNLNKKTNGIHIEQIGGHYFLRSGKDIIFQKQRVDSETNNDDRLVTLLKNEFKTEPFSLKQAKEFLNVSQTKTFYLIKPQLEKDLQKIGKGPGTKYKFVA